MICFLLLVTLSSARAAVDYTGYKVFRVIPSSEGHLEWLQQQNYDFWKEPTVLHRPADVMVHSSEAQHLMTSLSNQKMDYYLTVDDVQKVIDVERIRRSQKSESNFTDYMDYDQDRMWRKTRNPHDEDNSNPCVGADPNRNFDFMWMYVGASDNPCDSTFAGPYAHSEPETANQRDYMFDKQWLRVANIGVDALTSVYGTEYEVGSAADILYPSSGTSRDWAYGHNRTQIPYVYTLELRNKSSFVLPPDQIIPTGNETWIGLKAAILAMNLSSPKVET
ncbi:hypothetical protein LSH36_250g02024 [Paralvinella palmiformis]|uniref:Peptidase M14 domain-containing protein n=1 Tax=Paralvinella palmiformis TaxID=53620 RepID=A0AAD9JM80_9ANNE|nr:hypothetical protein LSH36_250g02024 [Paralvinella palmiformis]